MSTTQDILSWRGEDLHGSDGAKIGRIEEIYLDAETREPEWALVNTGLFGTRQSFVPLREASKSGDGITVPFDKSTVKDAPTVDPDGQLSQDEEAQLYSHYGMEYGESQSGSGLPESGTGTADRETTTGYDTSGPTTDSAMTRSEEELHVGTAKREAGRARLVKHVVEEEVTQTVPVRREEVRIEREEGGGGGEPITDGNVGDAKDGPEISSEEHEVVLHEETPVAEKRVVPKERVRLDTEVQTEDRQVSETVRKEQLDVDESGTTR